MKDYSGPAFPSPGVVMDDGRGGEFQQGAYEGMTLRDYFAAKAMQAIISAHMKTPDAAMIAPKLAYQLADLMLMERAA